MCCFIFISECFLYSFKVLDNSQWRKTTLQSGYFENICCSAFLKAAVLESVFSCVTGCRHDIHLNAEQVRKGQENWKFRETFRRIVFQKIAVNPLQLTLVVSTITIFYWGVVHCGHFSIKIEILSVSFAAKKSK